MNIQYISGIVFLLKSVEHCVDLGDLRGNHKFLSVLSFITFSLEFTHIQLENSSSFIYFKPLVVCLCLLV